MDSNDQWSLKWDHHPTKRLFFEKDYSGGKPFMKVWGTGFQGLDDPPPEAFVPNTSLGDWRIPLNNENSSYVIGLDYARELWGRMTDMGWIPIDTTQPPRDSVY